MPHDPHDPLSPQSTRDPVQLPDALQRAYAWERRRTALSWVGVVALAGVVAFVIQRCL